MAKLWVHVLHQKKGHETDCLAACAAMILSHLGIKVNYRQLLRLLEVDPLLGAFSSNITRLEQLSVNVEYGDHADLPKIEQHLSQGQPVITFVDTGELPYWNERTFHAVVVVGIDEQFLYLNDPAFDEAPQIVGRGDFELAWIEQDERYAVITAGQ
jgi:ABC-type bacteriocin/lantibiotic exporter with double-glycine peptidase domain